MTTATTYNHGVAWEEAFGVSQGYSSLMSVLNIWVYEPSAAGFSYAPAQP
ncbi:MULTISPECIES: hypothetical protein [unclassified Paenibacillus]|nr:MULTISPECIES: hypothetical protein [unclassified Paenibacillus]EPD93464.1 hypothetical protein HMPREF1207_00030 [Paenibacillus sp. HGH0039]